ncbi:sigma factor-like helix-turn-helix DNA-binding protein [Desulfofundulus kuznetsovii]|uniref:sigma factor-like helix-turn-helix DNA-binding protein n=1 Tax=Desulfofundulus kuznetsovii TaxID=58135 RepID=UPI00059E3083
MPVTLYLEDLRHVDDGDRIIKDDCLRQLAYHDDNLDEVERRLDIELAQPLIEAALSVLTPTQRQAFILYIGHRMPLRQIAAVTGTSFQAIQQTLNRAIDRITLWRNLFHLLQQIAEEHDTHPSPLHLARVAAELTQSACRDASHPLKQPILEALRSGPMTTEDLARTLGRPRRAINMTMVKLARRGLVRRINKGTYVLAKAGETHAQTQA